MKNLKLSLVALAAVSVFTSAQAQNFYATTDKFGYTGTVSKYATLADAQAQQNAVGGPFTVGQRDAALYQVDNVSSFDTDANYFLFGWYYTTADNTNGYPKDDPLGDNYYSGNGNPTNNLNGVVQMAEDDRSSVTSSNGGWTDMTFSSFNVQVSGANLNYDDGFSRLWPGNSNGGDDGTFVSYSLNLTANGLNGVLDSSDNLYESTNQPTSVTGSFNAIFENQSTATNQNGFYTVNLNFNDINWAFAQGDAALNGNFADSNFGAAAPVPEPASIAALGLGAAALLRRRRRNSK